MKHKSGPVSALQNGLVVAGFGRHVMVETDTGERIICHPRGKKNTAVVGDRIKWLATQDEHLGFDSNPRRLGTFATMCQLIIHAGTLGKALERGQQFYSLFGTDWSMSITHDLHEARLRVNAPLDRDIDHFITESMLMV